MAVEMSKSAIVRQEPTLGTNIAEINFRNTSVVNSIDTTSRLFLDLVQSSQETFEEAQDECIKLLDLSPRQLRDIDLTIPTNVTTVEPKCSTCHVHLAACADVLLYQVNRVCDICFKVVEEVVSIKEGEIAQQEPEPPVSLAQFRSLADTTSYRRLSTSEQVSQHLSTSIKWSVVKISNASKFGIPWDVSIPQVIQFFKNIKFPPPHQHSHFVHILADRSSGKTISSAYVETVSHSEAQRAVTTLNRKPLKGRLVQVTLSSQDELLSALFPSWNGDFIQGMAIPSEQGAVQSKAGHTFITRQEINSLLTICRNYKIHFSRKCPERPFENIMSIVCKYPWYQPNLVTALQRDHIYECLKLAIECLCTHVSKDYITIDPTLVIRMVRTGVMCPSFTERQQTVILNASGEECPEDIKHFIIPDQDRRSQASTSDSSSTTTSKSDNGNTDSINQLIRDQGSDISESSDRQQSQSFDSRIWFNTIPTHLLDILDGASNVHSAGVHSSFSTLLEYQQPRGNDLSQVQPASTPSSQSTTLSAETHEMSQSHIQERIRILCQQLRPFCKPKPNTKNQRKVDSW
ncbi:hypothetical protein Unana1_02467 [Umbelopsis nana]